MPNFDFSTLITDRTQADVDALVELLSTPMSDWTSEKLAEFNLAKSKGAYNYTDLNRVTACMDYLNERLTGYGYDAGYSKVEVPHGGGAGRLPSGYTELEYIESTGTQYVDTGFKPNQDTRMVLKARLISISGELGFAGQRYNSSVQAFAWLSISGSLRSYYNNNYDIAGTADTEIHIYDKNKNITYIDEEQVGNATYTTFKGDFSIYLCACHDETGSVLKSSSAVYECQIYDDGTLVRNYIPCINPSSEVGLYDTVNNTFYGNAGTGTFTAGPEVNWTQQPQEPSDELDPYTWYEEDTPTLVQMNQYLANVAAIRNVLQVYATTPETPADMNGLTYQEANDIEKILIAIEQSLINIQFGWIYSGEIYSEEIFI